MKPCYLGRMKGFPCFYKILMTWLWLRPACNNAFHATTCKGKWLLTEIIVWRNAMEWKEILLLIGGLCCAGWLVGDLVTAGDLDHAVAGVGLACALFLRK